MNTPIQKYQALIDALVACRESVVARKVAARELWPPAAEKAKFSDLITALTNEQCVELSKLLQTVRDGGIHDTLAVFSERMNCEGLRFVQQGDELPHEPYETELHFDWVARTEGDPWPE